jgi:hypothetical protein
MNILDTIINAQDGATVRRLGSQLGLGDDKATAALSAVIPALAAGLQHNMQTPDGLTRLSQALATGQHQSYLDDPSLLADPSTVTDGNGILGHLLGSKDVSRGLAANAAAQTGLSPDVIKRLLPIAATMVMGAVARHSMQASAAGVPTTGGGLASVLGPLLDSNRDGSMVDDVTGMIGKFFGQR